MKKFIYSYPANIAGVSRKEKVHVIASDRKHADSLVDPSVLKNPDLFVWEDKKFDINAGVTWWGYEDDPP